MPFGFVLIKDLRLVRDEDYDVNLTENYFYIDALCSSRKGTGVLLMDFVHYMCYETIWYNSYLSGFLGNEQKLFGTKLSSLAYVIPYYFKKYAYRFRQKDGSLNEKQIDVNSINITKKQTDGAEITFKTTGNKGAYFSPSKYYIGNIGIEIFERAWIISFTIMLVTSLFDITYYDIKISFIVI